MAWIIGTAVALLAYFVKGLTGFANTLVFSSIMSFTVESRWITPVDLVVGYPSNILIAYRGRKEIRVKVVVPLVCALAAGMIPGALLLSSGDDAALKRILGLTVIGLAVEMFLRLRKKKNRPQRGAVLLAIGIISGFFCGLFGIGAFLVAYIDRTTESTAARKANLCCVFAIECTIRTILYIITGVLTAEVMKNAILLYPGMALGLFLGLRVSQKAPERMVKNLTVLLLVIMGMSVFLSNLW